MAFASSLFYSSKFLEHTHTLTKRLTVLACSDNNKDVRTPFLAHFTLMLEKKMYVKILVGDIEGGAKKNPQFLFFFFFAPPSEWRPRRPPIPPVGKSAPVCERERAVLNVCVSVCACARACV